MDTHSSHLTAPNRSRSSQSPSPSHSSATSSIHKRKLASDDHAPPFPPSSLSADTRDGALTSNDDLESISARGGGADSDSDEDSDEEAPEAANAEDSDEDDSSIRTFTTARLDAANAGVGSGSARNTKIKTENLSSSATVKIENSDGTKDGGAQGTGPAGPTAPAGSSAPGIVVKEDATKIFTENIQTSGAYSAREESLKREVSLCLCQIFNLCLEN